MSILAFKNLSGQEAVPYLKDLAELRISVFREFPYLYDGDLEYEKKYLQTYFASPESLVILCFDGDQVVGASTAIPLKSEEANVQKPFIDQGIDPNQVMYFGESVLLEKYRGRGVGKEFFQRRLEYASTFPEIKFAAFCAVIRPTDHPSKPPHYRPLDELWQKFGFQKIDGMVGSYRWKDLGDLEESDKKMQFWLASLQVS